MTNKMKLKAFVPTMVLSGAKAFYKDVLNFELLHEDEYALEFDVCGTRLRVTVVRELQPQPFTILGWYVDDIVGIIKWLSEKGITFERFNYLQQDEYGIWNAPSGARVAWFKDPDGNMLSISSS
jgi:catechol 2,3-dioxygenase-like lactoylglutathione lyase family enzyme